MLGLPGSSHERILTKQNRSGGALGETMKRSLTQPRTSVQFHPHAHVHQPVRPGVEPHKAGDDWGPQVLQHNVVRVSIPIDHLETGKAEHEGTHSSCPDIS
ncbi:hypothetical protein chiPu_0025003 [Chiloscyllium punctatum]|uniref:Uncharacterized protein n=1 Tax=Chiloscyllium punctatum TaxID=137246 RepID=A0A401TF75_CHIPU|nr:hypothetical protein [Chiloscyllium punctatum]